MKAKKLMKSNESISRLIFLTKFYFLQFQKWPKLNFWTGKKFKNCHKCNFTKKFILFIWFHKFFCLDFFKFSGPLLCSKIRKMAIWENCNYCTPYSYLVKKYHLFVSEDFRRNFSDFRASKCHFQGRKRIFPILTIAKFVECNLGKCDLRLRCANYCI